MTNPILDTALKLLEHGYSVIPIRTDGSKAPALASWKRYTDLRTDVDQVTAWFTDPARFDLGVVQGRVSGNAELTEVEGRATGHLPELKALAHDSGLGDLWDTITTGWVEMSPSGGFHFHYRVTNDTVVPGNAKLARDINRLVLAETRGEGGQVVVAPSRHHATGRPWVRLVGGPATAPLLTLDERNAFHAILRTLDETPEPSPAQTGPAVRTSPHDPADGVTPLDDYETRTDWSDILIPHGWVLVTTRGGRRYWRRPGKTIGISATTGGAEDGRDRLYIFTTSTDFQTEIPYTKPGALAVLEHGGDHSAAAKALYNRGFGQRAEQRRDIAGPDTFFDDILTPTNGETSWPSAPAGSRPAPASTTAPSTPSASVDTLSANTTRTEPAPSTAPTAPAPASPTTSEPATYTETDDGNALRLVDTHIDQVRFVPQRGQWLTWDGHRWRWDEAGHVHELARDIARTLPRHDKESRRHRAHSLSRRGLEAMVAIARTDPRTTVHLAHLDARPYELNTPTGVVDLRTGTLSHPDPAALHTRSTNVAPDFNTPPTRWLSFLADTFAGDPTLTAYMQRLIGISLAGTVLEQVLPFAHGAGANGKTTFAGVLQRILGLGDDGYTVSAPAEMLLATRNPGHPTEIARLAGARLVITSELEDDQRFAEARVKMLTGSDPISGRFMRQDWFTFIPTHTLWLLANHLPAVRAGGPAFWRRIRMLPFEHTVPVDQRITGLEQILVDTEGPAILAWAIHGAVNYFGAGLAEPATVLAATTAYERDTDTVARFVEDCCETGDPNAQHMHVATHAVRAAYERWCRTEGETPVSPKALTQQLRARFGVQSNRTMSTRFYDGLRLTEPSSDGSDPSSEEPSWTQDTGW